MVIVGLLLLLFGWFGYNLGCFANIFEAHASTTNQGNWILSGRSATVSMLAILTAGIVTLLGRWLLVGHWDELNAFIGPVGGIAAISSGCSVVEPWAAVVCGFRGRRLGSTWSPSGELLAIVGWVNVTMSPLFWILHKLRILRISNDEEIASFEDISSHRFQENHAQFGDYTPMQISNSDSKEIINILMDYIY
ncbi:Ammonium transporter [Parasponia andersonii]|uniref:Ammonium transporter n=1 Tax=Parasponia andersonii TaxID=3476 RepID=A0A2P5CSV9_PARAD|nr:Ammonium transporter [Parasponia andersonii]